MGARVFSALAEHATQRGDLTAMRMWGVVVTWADLAAQVVTLSRTISGTQGHVGIACASPMAAAIADLAITHAGRVCVHLPSFFSLEQQDHIIAVAGIGAIIGDGAARPGIAQIAVGPFGVDGESGALAAPRAGAKRIIFTSGSSGTPKGVIIGEAQMTASLDALGAVIVAQENDRHLSVLPMAQLLEQIAGLYLTILAGVEIVFSPHALAALFGGPIDPLIQEIADNRPTTTILVPALLARLVDGYERAGKSAPDCLRFVAVGGAPCAPALLRRAEMCGLAVHVGYGLSECSSVVAMNRPGMTRRTSVGPILPGLSVRIDEGEVIVSGPTVMEGYLGQNPVQGEWRTGDLGRFEDGHLVIEGRKDWLIITPTGRNISPEWVEARLCADPRVPAAGLVLDQEGALSIVVALAAPMHPDEIAALLVRLPAYARPKWAVCVPANRPGFLKIGGGIDRSQLAQICAETLGQELTYQEEFVV